MNTKSIVLALLLTASSAYAAPRSGAVRITHRSRPVPVYMVNLENPTVDYRTLNRVSRRVIEYYRGYGARLNARKTERRADPFFDLRDQGTFYSFHQEFISWWQTLHSEGKIKPNVATHVLAPSWTVDGDRYIAGWAFEGSLPKGAFSYSNCDLLIKSGNGSIRYCVAAMAHEIGHSVFGCDHEDGANLMNANALQEQLILERWNPQGRLLPLGEKCLAKVRQFNARNE